MKRIDIITTLIIVITISGCSKGETFSADINNPDLLPDRENYFDKDYGTQKLAQEMDGIYNSDISVVFYDSETRKIPQLYLTRGEHTIKVSAQKDGTIKIDIERFNTEFMPLYLSTSIKTQLTEKGDTLFLKGSDGAIRTHNDNGVIGVPEPESDDGELIGTYIRSSRDLKMIIDPMLPMPVKLHTTRKLNN